MAIANPGLSYNYPVGVPNSRVPTPTGQPPIVAPLPSPFQRMKAGLPKLPPAIMLFHKPRQPGNG